MVCTGDVYFIEDCAGVGCSSHLKSSCCLTGFTLQLTRPQYHSKSSISEHIRANKPNILMGIIRSKKISNDQELIQSDPISCPQNQKGNN